MILSKKSSILAVLSTAPLLSLPSLHLVDAHGYLKTPRSRNYHASIEGKYWGGTATDPSQESCPHCLNIGGTEARCGLVGDHNYDLPPNAIGGVMPPTLQGCYKEGAIIDVESVLTAHHKVSYSHVCLLDNEYDNVSYLLSSQLRLTCTSRVISPWKHVPSLPEKCQPRLALMLIRWHCKRIVLKYLQRGIRVHSFSHRSHFPFSSSVCRMSCMEG